MKWIEDDADRKKVILSLYNDNKSKESKTRSTQQIYLYYKRLSILKLLYKEMYREPENDFSRFCMDLKESVGKSYNER